MKMKKYLAKKVEWGEILRVGLCDFRSFIQQRDVARHDGVNLLHEVRKQHQNFLLRLSGLLFIRQCNRDVHYFRETFDGEVPEMIMVQQRQQGDFNQVWSEDKEQWDPRKKCIQCLQTSLDEGQFDPLLVPNKCLQYHVTQIKNGLKVFKHLLFELLNL